MKKHYLKLLMVCFCLVSITNLNATLPDGADASDFTLSDIDGTTHNLFGYLSAGKSVVIDMSATWCGPCWTFHQAGTMDDIYSDYGPGGEDMMMAMLIEVDPSTNQACFYGPSGCNNSTLGDWSAGIDFPLINPGSTDAANVNDDYDITLYPTMYVISPSGWVKSFVGSGTSYDDIERWGAFSFQMHNSTWDVEGDGCGLGSIDLHPFQGYGSISYEWSNGATSEDLNEIPAGEYYVTLTDDNGYEAEIGPIEVESSPAMITEMVSLVDVDCNGNNTGYLEIETTGGTEDFDYEWDNGENGPILENLFEGDYSVTIVDNNTGCESYASYNIYEPSIIEVEYDLTPAGCNGEMGEIEFDIDGGTYPFTYVINGETYYDDDIELPAGDYFADITDFNSCTSNASFSIAQPPAPTAMSSALGEFNCTSNPVYVSGTGSSTGTNIDYAWYDAAGTYLGDTEQIQVTTAGNYSLTVLNTDTDCSSISMVSVTTNTTTPVAMSSAANTLTCNAPSAIVSGAGSTNDGSATFNWSTTDGNIVGAPTTMDITVDAPGTYTLTVINSVSGCSSMTSQTISAASPPSIAAPGNTSFCTGSTSNVCIALGTNETIQWTSNGVVVGTSSCITANATQTYMAMVTNTTTGCSASQSVQTTANALPLADITGNNSFCPGGSTTLCHTQEAGVTYSWALNGNNIPYNSCISVNQSGMVNLISSNASTGCENTKQMSIAINAIPVASIAAPSNIDCSNTSSLLDLTVDDATSTVSWFNEAGLLISNEQDITVGQAGTYTAMVTNSNGCQTQSSATVTADTSIPQVSIAQPNMLNCSNQSSLLNLTVENTGYTISWYDTNGNLVSNDEDITVTSAGSYTATVVNSAGCETQASVLVTADTSLPQISINQPNMLNCTNQTSFLNLNIDNTGYSITWSDANGNVISNDEDISVSTAGTYTASVINSAGCETQATVVVQADTTVPQVSIAAPSSVLDCNNSMVTLAAEIINGSSQTWYDANGSNLGEGTSINVTQAGQYTISVTNSAGCEAMSSVIVEQVNNAVALVGFDSAANELELQFNDMTQSSSSVSYSWDFGDGNTSTEANPIHTYATPGYYTVCLEVTNECGSSTECEEVLAVAEMNTSADVTQVTCNGANDGSITIVVNGGLADYTYTWSDASITGSTAMNLAPGDYSVSVKDELGTEATQNITITEPMAISISADITGSSSTTSEGAIALDIAGGTAGYLALWSDGSTDINRTGLAQAEYSVVITDANGCETTETFTVPGSTNVNELEALTQFNVSPNPAINFINVEGQFNTTTDVQISLLSMTGQRTQVITTTSKVIKERIDLSNFATGVYLLELRSNDKVAIKKIIITE